jgi:hypothetical protein
MSLGLTRRCAVKLQKFAARYPKDARPVQPLNGRAILETKNYRFLRNHPAIEHLVGDGRGNLIDERSTHLRIVL